MERLRRVLNLIQLSQKNDKELKETNASAYARKQEKMFEEARGQFKLVLETLFLQIAEAYWRGKEGIQSFDRILALSDDRHQRQMVQMLLETRNQLVWKCLKRSSVMEDQFSRLYGDESDEEILESLNVMDESLSHGAALQH